MAQTALTARRGRRVEIRPVPGLREETRLSQVQQVSRDSREPLGRLEPLVPLVQELRELLEPPGLVLMEQQVPQVLA